MATLPDLIERLSPEAQKVYDRRFDATLPGDVRELAILVTARTIGQAYEWVAHAPLALKAGLPAEVVERIRTRGDLATLPPRYARAVRVVQHVLAFESVSAPLADEVQADLGVAGLLELVVLPGHYRVVGGVLSAFEVPLPEGAQRPF